MQWNTSYHKLDFHLGTTREDLRKMEISEPLDENGQTGPSNGHVHKGIPTHKFSDFFPSSITWMSSFFFFFFYITTFPMELRPIPSPFLTSPPLKTPTKKWFVDTFPFFLSASG